MTKKQARRRSGGWETDPNLMGPFAATWTHPNGHHYDLELGYGLSPEGRVVLTSLYLSRPEGVMATDVDQFPTNRVARENAPDHAELIQRLADEIVLDAAARKQLASYAREPSRPGGRPAPTEEHLRRDAAAYSAGGFALMKEVCDTSTSTSARHRKRVEELGWIARPNRFTWQPGDLQPVTPPPGKKSRPKKAKSTKKATRRSSR